MSVFKVVLNQNGQGNLDLNPVSDPLAAANIANSGLVSTYGQVGVPFGAGLSKQREVYIMGPDRINRLLVDGATFTDCNYWKQYVLAPSGSANANTAFLTLLSDDGSVWSSVPGENVAMAAFDIIVVGGTTFGTAGTFSNVTGYVTGGNLVNIISTFGGYAVAAQLQNLDTSHDVKVQMNGSANAVFTLEHNTTQVFAPGEVTLSSIDFSNNASGASSVNYVQVLLTIASACQT